MLEQPLVTLGLSVIWTLFPAYETAPSVSTLVPVGALTLIVVGDPSPSGDAGSFHPDHRPLRWQRCVQH